MKITTHIGRWLGIAAIVLIAMAGAYVLNGFQVGKGTASQTETAASMKLPTISPPVQMSSGFPPYPDAHFSSPVTVSSCDLPGGGFAGCSHFGSGLVFHGTTSDQAEKVWAWYRQELVSYRWHCDLAPDVHGVISCHSAGGSNKILGLQITTQNNQTTITLGLSGNP